VATPVTSITLTAPGLTGPAGARAIGVPLNGSVVITADASPADALVQTMVWTSSDNDVASVAGVLRPAATGRMVITGPETAAEITGVSTGTANITVVAFGSGGVEVRETITVTVALPMAMVSAGDQHTVAICEEGALWAWGNRANGRLGDEETSGNVTTPIRIGTHTDWVLVSAGSIHTMGIREETPGNRTLWAWGSGANGRLGTGATGNQSSPVQIGAYTDWQYVIASGAHSFGIREDAAGDRTLWAWGSRANGILGLGYPATGNVTSPTQVTYPAETGWDMVSAAFSGAHAIAVRDDGTLWAWGAGSWGRLGTGDTDARYSPYLIYRRALEGATMPEWAQVSAGDSHNMAICVEGRLWAWGDGWQGRLGTGNSNQQNRIVPVGALTNWAYVSAGDSHSLGIRADGTLWAWGAGTNGRLGDGFTATRNSPVQVGAGTVWASVSAGGAHSTAICADGFLWTWGSNANGRTGLDTIDGNQLTPMRVGVGD